MIQVAFDLRDPDRSGIARVARSISRSFAELDVAGRFDLTFAGPVETLERLGASQWGARTPSIIPWNSGRLSAQAEIEWPRIDRRTRNSVWYFPHFDMPWIARPKRAIVVIHDLIALRVPGATSPLRRALASQWIRWSGKRAARIVVGTEFTRLELVEQWPCFADRISVVPHGVDRRFFNPAPPLPPDLVHLAGGPPFMLSVGNRKPHKNLAMGAEVLARIPELHWVIIGERFRGWESVAERVAALRVSDRVHVIDPRPDEVLHALYASAVCLFFPSRHEGFGLPVLEALASGTRVVAGAAGASVEVLGGHGAVCDLDDPDDFADAVRIALRSGVPGPAGRAHAAAFTWERSAKRIADLVEDLE